MQLTDLQVDRRRVVVGGSLVLRGDVRVDGPRPGLSIEIRYFARGGTRHFTEMTDAERLDHTIFRWSTSTDETLGARLGRAAFECRLDRNVIVGEVDVAVLAIDRSTGDLLAECWRPVVFGTPRPDAPTAVMCPIDVRWSAVRSTAGRSRGPDRQR